ncbi:MAG: hypothetical protein SGJ19_12795 [Planctomycetia bacterium]|nr:hypothetical protein [Planctomycetia bacterium]
MRRWLVLATLIGLPATMTQAAMIPLAQSRTVLSFGNATTPEESDSDGDQSAAADFGLFDDLVGHAARAGSASSDGFASQKSTIKPGAVNATLSADAFVGAFGIDDGADGGSSSHFDLEFAVDTPGRYKLYLSGSANNNGSASLILTEEGGGVSTYWDTTFESSRIEGFLLKPGDTYSISAIASASGFLSGGGGSPDGQAGMSFTLRQVPEPASIYLTCVLAASCAAMVVGKSKPRVKAD